MEFKKSNRYSNGRVRISVPQRGNNPAVHSSSSQPQQPLQSQKPPVASATKTTSPSPSHFFNRKKIIISSIILIIIAGLIVGIVVHTANSTKKTDDDSISKVIENTGYQTVLPDGKSISELGGWERISPANSDPVYAYTDSIDGTSISVSEQPLPKTFEGDAESQLAELAQKFNATNKITAGDTAVYLGTSAKGPQSALFIKINLLVLIKSQNKISDDAWIKYIKSLNA